MADAAGIYARECPSLDRVVQLGIAQGRVLAVDFPEAMPPDAGTEHDLLDRIEAYLDGETEEFQDVTIAMTMQTDHAEVLERVRDLPYGENATVEQLAHLVPGRGSADEDDQRVIREALADNPVPLLIPDHRVRDGPSGAPPAVEQRLRSLEGL